jgi:hypothetical protein
MAKVTWIPFDDPRPLDGWKILSPDEAARVFKRAPKAQANASKAGSPSEQEQGAKPDRENESADAGHR